MQDEQMHDKGSMAALSLGALGVVYGDIGTSPLYAFKEAFNPAHSLGYNPANIYGVLSLIFWGLTIIVTVKYVGLALRADNEGEGGILALMALVMRRYAAPSRGRVLAVALGLIGAAMFYGDSIITPAISVLSAIEGTAVATPVLQDAVIPITAAILVGLFLVQKRGTALVGAYFGPVMMLWFGAIGVLGLTHIVIHPSVLRALNPWWGMDMFLREPRLALFLLGAVFLTLTGGEALYADMGHFGRLPIRRAWLGVVMPGLLLNYFGQGALVMANPAAGKNPFFYMAPSWALWPLVVLATLATVIASQAVISGAYSMTTQAIKLGYLPRMRVLFTNERNQGQIYVPFINWTMLLFVLALVMAFRSSDNLAAAYGIAVNITMVTTTVFLWMVAPQRWGWSTRRANIVFVPLALVEVLFLASNSLKIDHGGWFPLVFGAAVYTLLSTWKRGRSLLKRQLQEHALNLKDFVHSLSTYPPTRVEGTAIYLTPNADTVPHALLHNLKHNKVLHERVVFLSAQAADVPHVGPDQGIDLRPMEEGIYLLHVRYGFKDEPDIQKLLKDCERLSGLEFHLMETSFFLARQTIVPSKIPGMALWREVLFSWMSRNAQEASDYFRIPPNRVVELGTQIEI